MWCWPEQSLEQLERTGCSDQLVDRISAARPGSPGVKSAGQLFAQYLLPRKEFQAFCQACELYAAVHAAVVGTRHAAVAGPLLCTVVFGVVRKYACDKDVHDELRTFHRLCAQDDLDLALYRREERKVLQALGWDLGVLSADTCTCILVLFQRLRIALPGQELEQVWNLAFQSCLQACRNGQSQGYLTAAEALESAAKAEGLEHVRGWPEIFAKVVRNSKEAPEDAGPADAPLLDGDAGALLSC